MCIKYEKFYTSSIRKHIEYSKQLWTSRGETSAYSFPLIAFVVRSDYSVRVSEDFPNIIDLKKLNVELNITFYTLKLIENAVAYFKKKTFVLPPVSYLFLWFTDRPPLESYGLFPDVFPYLSFAFPKNFDYLIPFPDISFECFHYDQKYRGRCYNWDEVKSRIITSRQEHKQDLAYFKGTKTGIKVGNFREVLQKEATRTKAPVSILLDGWKQFESLSEMNKYSVLLNLPGHYVWSNRFKYLFLSKGSLVVDIRPVMKRTNGPPDDPVISFIDLFVKKNKHYISFRPQLDKKNEHEIQREATKIIDKITTIVSEHNKYFNISENGFNKVSRITNKSVYHYIYDVIWFCSKKIVVDLA